MEDALIEVPTMRRFAGIDLISDRIPDETTILSFLHLIEKNKLGKEILYPFRGRDGSFRTWTLLIP
jgi:IS5 family transposase